jgi:GrpB-like predicted nucleotidyltransferase (UPF0157 family)
VSFKGTFQMQEERTTDSPGANTPLTEEQIIAATIGPRKPINSTIYLAPYDPAWPSLFIQLKEQIQAALGDTVLMLEHVGSTSVPGLSAKPIIDMVMAVADSSDETSYVKPLEDKGYTLRIREPDWYEHRELKSPKIAGNLHVFSAGCKEIGQMVLFRDWLRDHADARSLYEATKRELAARTWKYTQNYADAKSEVVQEILARARRSQY